MTAPAATTTTYEKIGGDAAVGKLCDRFYELMDTVPQFAELPLAAQQP